MVIPSQVKVYKPFSKKKRFSEVRHPEKLIYKAGKELIEVLLWCRYPSYDFIFGVPGKGNKYAKDEAAFFQYRDVRHKRIKEGFYLDKIELKEFCKGFNMLLREVSK